MKTTAGNVNHFIVQATTGNVGIGTSSPVENNTGARTLQMDGAGFGVDIRLTNTATGATAGNGSTVVLDSTNFYLWNYENAFTAFGTNNTERMRIDSSGNVGIGNNNPSQKLSVAGAIESTRTGGVAFYATGAGNYNQQNGASGTAWAYGPGGGNTAPGTASTTFGMHHWNGNSWKNPLNIDTSGNVTMPYQPAFEVRNSGNFTLPSSGEAKTIFTTVRNNRGNHYSTSTGRFTAPVSGTYLFTHCGSIYSGSQNPYLTTIFKKNGTVCSSYGRGSLSQSSGTHYGSAPLTAIVDMNANEYVELWCYSGATGASFYNGEANFSGFLIG